jgi:tetratricopeptide (TPR) repeat protein
MDYTKICFVVMPFGVKPVGEKKIWFGLRTKEQKVNFDNIYDNVFVPAIKAVKLPEGGFLEPRRTDRDFFTGSIPNEMFRYIEYSRFVVADISGLNANVFWELGFRHRSRESGTAIFRQTDSPIPFDINQIKAFPYEYQPEDKIKKSQELITQVLTESLQQNRIDSPIQIALIEQQKHVGIEGILREAEDAIRYRDIATAILRYREALRADSTNPVLHLKLGLLLKAEGKWQEALAEFNTAIIHSPSYAEAYREKGIAENKLFMKEKRLENIPTGEESLNKAIVLNPEDFDALSSLGGVLKRQERYEESVVMYRRATEVSKGHSYPLLNEIILQARIQGSLVIDQEREFMLKRVQRSLETQVTNNPPYNPPWSFFDLSNAYLLLGDEDNSVKVLQKGLEECNHRWQAKSHFDTLMLLRDGNVEVSGLNESIVLLQEALNTLPQ